MRCTSRAKEGASMTSRVTELVNEVIAEGTNGRPLSEDEVLALIDQGASQGGSEVGSAVWLTGRLDFI